jgi:hypothetical protein
MTILLSAISAERRRRTQTESLMKIGNTAQVWKNSSVEYVETTVKIRRARILNARPMCVTTPGQRRPAAETGNEQLP